MHGNEMGASGITAILNYLEAHTVSLVITAIVIFFSIRFGNLGFEYVASKLKEKKHGELIDIRTNVNKTINSLIDRAMLRTNACRAYVLEFHNGITALGGLPFLKMSCTYEFVNEGVKSAQYTRDNIPLSLHSSMVDGIIENDFIVLDPENRSEEHSHLVYEMLVEQQTLKSVRVKIMNSYKQVIGCFGVDYCREYRLPETDEDLEKIKSVLKETAMKIGVLLSVK
jgi:hypothetical protein